MKRVKFPRLGPGALVTAAFIGPGTITACSLAGAGFGYALLWALLFSTIATVVLQEMAARLGIVTRQGLGEALRLHFSSPVARFAAAALVISAIAIGNAAFQTGNLLGASLGLETLFPASGKGIGLWPLPVAVLSFLLLYAGDYKLIERVLVALVVVMSLTFLATAAIVAPSAGSVLRGMLLFSLPEGSLLTVAGLIGTTVVPYNLFLHASAVQERWKDSSGLGEARSDIVVSVVLGGAISMAIVVSSAASHFGSGGTIASGADLALQLRPLLGEWGRYFIGIGLFAAGISSAITAPLAAAYATCGILGWKRDLRSGKFRLVWALILAAGTLFALAGFKPLEAILFAQAANGILLPVMAVFLLLVMNSAKVMGKNSNGWLSNVLGVPVVLVAIFIGIRGLLRVFGVM